MGFVGPDQLRRNGEALAEILPYGRIFHESGERGYSDAVMEKVMLGNAEGVLVFDGGARHATQAFDELPLEHRLRDPARRRTPRIVFARLAHQLHSERQAVDRAQRQHHCRRAEERGHVAVHRIADAVLSTYLAERFTG